MYNIYKVSKYLLDIFKMQFIICFSCIGFNILLAFAVTYLLSSAGRGSAITVGSIDIIAFIWMLILGLIFFKPSFKFMLSYGISRKRFFKGTMLCLIIISLLGAAAVMLISVASRNYVNINVLYEILYKNLHPLGFVVWSFTLLLLMGVLGLFINLLYYRSSRQMKYIISLSPLVLSASLTIFDILSNGGMLRSLFHFLVLAMGFPGGVSESTPNPYIGALTMLTLSAVISGFIFLLIRRAPIKD